MTQVAKGPRERLSVFGDDYPTIDGTGIRNYIYVLDLALDHVAALENLTDGGHVYNLGAGKVTCILELVKALGKAINIKVPYEVAECRLGDIAPCYARCFKIGDRIRLDI